MSGPLEGKKGKGSGRQQEAPEAITKSVDVNRQMAMIFGTPVISQQWSDSEKLNVSLTKLILSEEANNTGVVKSNAGGWHSDTHLLARTDESIVTLKSRIRHMVRELTQAVSVDSDAILDQSFHMEGWATVNRDKAYNRVHTHPHALWSGVYYVASGQMEGDWPENGKLELVDPRAGINQIQLEQTVMTARYVIDPLPGLMIMFPSWLQHFVHPFYGSGERISIAFNVQPMPDQEK